MNTGTAPDVTTKQPLPVGSMVWGKLPGYNMWPGLLISYEKQKDKPLAMEEEECDDDEDERKAEDDVEVWIKWFGDNQLSQVCSSRQERVDVEWVLMLLLTRDSLAATVQEVVSLCPLQGTLYTQQIEGDIQKGCVCGT